MPFKPFFSVHCLAFSFLYLLCGSAWAAPAPSAPAPLQVLQMTPQGEVERFSQITVLFSEDMRPLGVMEQEAAQSPLKLRLKDAPSGSRLPEGQWRWLDTRTLAYILAEPQNGAIALEASIPAELKALNGAALPQGVSWSLHTPPIQISFPEPAVIENSPKPLFRFLSNQPLNPDDLKSKAALTANGHNLPITIRNLSSAGGNTPGAWVYEVQAQQSVAPAQKLVFSLQAGILPLQGVMPSKEFQFSFSGYTPLQIKGWRIDGQAAPKDKKDGRLYPDESLALELNNPVNIRDVATHLSIEPAAEAAGELAESNISYNSTYIRLAYRLAPRTDYTLTLKPGLKDIYGTSLAQEQRFTFRTADYRPMLYIPGGSLLEAAQGGVWSLFLRNAPFSGRFVNLRLTPDFVEKLLAKDTYDYNALSELGGLNAQQEFNFAGQLNRLLYYPLRLPQLFTQGQSGPGATPTLGGTAFFAELTPLWQADTSQGKEPPRTAWLAVTNIGLTCSLGKDSALIWAASLDKGRPLPGVNLRLYSSAKGANGSPGKAILLWQGRTDAQGLAQAKNLPAEEIRKNTLYLLAEDTQREQSADGTKNAGSPANANAEANAEADAALMRVEKFFGLAQVNQQGLNRAFNGEAPLAGHAITQLPLYQPGQSVNFVLYLRAMPGLTWLPVPEQGLQVQARDPQGKVVYTQNLRSSAFGSVSGSFALSEEARLGSYTFTATQASGGAVYCGSFNVQSFRRPEFKVDIDTPADILAKAEKGKEKDKEKPGLTVSGAYFFGQALAGAALKLEIRQSEAYFAPPSLNGYAVGLPSGYSNAAARSDKIAVTSGPATVSTRTLPHMQTQKTAAELNGKLDAEGQAFFAFPDIPVEAGLPLRLNLEALVTDPAGLTSQGAADCLLHPSKSYVGLKAPYFNKIGADIKVEFKATDWRNVEISSGKVAFYVENAQDGKRVWSGEAALAQGKPGLLHFQLNVSGSYYLYAAISDAEGRTNISRTHFYLYNPQDASGYAYNAPYRGQAENTLALTADKSSYHAGESALIMVHNPLKPLPGEDAAYALVSLERDNVLRAWITRLNPAEPFIKIDLQEADGPYVYAVVTTICGRSAPFEPSEWLAKGLAEGQPQEISPKELEEAREKAAQNAPQVRHGHILLQLNATTPARPDIPEQAEPAFTLNTDKKTYRPAEKVKATLRPNGKGQTEPCEITLLAVDERVLRAAGEHNNYNPGATFQPLFLHGMSTSDNRVNLLNFSHIEHFNRFSESKSKSFAAVAQLGQDQAGGTEATLRANFSAEAFWLAQGVTEASGTFNAEFTLPDSLTSYRLVAITADKKGGFSLAQTTVSVSKPLQLLPSLPAFITQGDTLSAQVTVQNLSPLAGEVSLSLSLPQEGPLKLGKKETTTGSGEALQKVTLAAGQSRKLAFTLTAQGIGQASLRFAATMGAEKDAALFSLPVLPATPLTTVAASGLLQPGQSYSLPLRLPALAPGQGAAYGPGATGGLDPRSRLELSMAPSPAAGLDLVAQELLDYPWHCLEQRLSRSALRALRLQHGQLLGLPPEKDDRANIIKALAPIASFQNPDGSFRLWPEAYPTRSPGNNEGAFYLTAYTLLAYSHMRGLDIALPEAVQKEALAYLTETLTQNLAQHNQQDGQKRLAAKPAKALSPEAQAIGLWAWSCYHPDKAAPWLARARQSVLADNRSSPLAIGALLLAGQLTGENAATPEPTPANAPASTPGNASGGAPSQQALLLQLEKSAVITPTQLHFTTIPGAESWQLMGSSLRDNALVLWALCQSQPDYTRLEGLAYWMAQGLGERTTLSTQEAIYGLWGLSAYLQVLQAAQSSGAEQPAAVASMRAAWGSEIVDKSFSHLVSKPYLWTIPADKLAAGQINTQTDVKTDGQNATPALRLTALAGRPYWTARLSYAQPGLKLQPVQAGLGLSRSINGAEQKIWRTGDIMEVEITLNVPETRRHVLIYDPWPAGFEPLHASRADLSATEKQQDPAQGEHYWQWHEMRQDGLVLYSPSLNPGVYHYKYRLRAYVPGRFAQRPSRAEEMYTPEVFARTAGAEVVVE